MSEEERDEALDQNLSRLLANGRQEPALDPERRAEMLEAMKAKQAEIAGRSVPAQPGALAPAWRWEWLAAAAALLLVVFGLWRLAGTGGPRPPIDPLPDKPFPLVARPNVVSKALVKTTLDDGTVVIARQGSEYTTSAPRLLKLVKGDLYLIVAKAETPFVVQTEHGRVNATGTRFAVSVSTETQVAVAQGRVRLISPTGEIELKRGQRGQLSAAGRPVRSPAPRVSYLVNWARDALSQPERLVEKKKQSAELVAVDPWGQQTRLALRKYHVDVHIEDGIARTTVDQTFFNHVPWNIEGTFYFPLPPDASVSRLAMYVNGQLMEGGMVDRSRGQEIYTQIVFQRRDPALLEMMEGNLFKLRIFPIEGRQEKRIFISYTQKLEELYGTQRYWFPMEHTHHVANELSFQVRVKDGAGRFSPASSTHELETATAGSDLVLNYEAQKAKPDQDFLLNLLPAEQARRTSFATLDKDGHRYVFARVTPVLEGEAQPKPRQWIVLNDVSTSRTKTDIRAQAHILRRWIAEADDADAIALINVDTEARLQADGLSSVRDQGALKLVGQAWVSQPLGGTNLEAAFGKAGELIRKHQLDNPYLLYLGDGVATDGRKTVDELLHQLPKGATFIGIGVGKKADARLLQAAADETGGTFTLINPDEDLDWRVFDLMAALNTPRLVGLEARFETAAGKAAEIVSYPSARTLAEGESLTVVGRTDSRLPGALVLKGKVGGQGFERRYSLAEAVDKAEFIPRFWAKRHIDEMLKYGEEHKDEIIQLSKQYYVMTPYTSLIVLENEAMYQEFKVERGRKDHWALYPAPKKIEVVKEPVNWSRWSWWGWGPGEDEKAKAKAKPKSVQEIVDSVQFRINAPFYYWRPQRRNTGRFALYGLLDAKADPARLLTWVLLSEPQKREYLTQVIGHPSTDAASIPGTDTSISERLPLLRKALADSPVFSHRTRGWARFARGRLAMPVFDRIAEDGLSFEVTLSPLFAQQAAQRMLPPMVMGEERRGKSRISLSYGLVSKKLPPSSLLMTLGLLRSGGFIDRENMAALSSLRPPDLNLEMDEELEALPAICSGLSGDFGGVSRASSLSPQLSRSFVLAFGKRMARIDQDIRQHNARYGGYYWGDEWAADWNSIDLRRSASARWWGGPGALEDSGETGEPQPRAVREPPPLQALITSLERQGREKLPPSLLLASYSEALNSLPGTAGALAVDFLAARRDELLGIDGKLTKEQAGELTALQAALRNLPSTYPRLENPAVFWSHQGWNYRPRPWTFQAPQVQAYHHYNWTFDLTRYADGLYSTAADVLDTVAAEYGLGPAGKTDEKVKRLIDAARRAIRPVRLQFGEQSPEILLGPGDRLAFKHTTEMYLEEQFVCNGESILHIYPELGLAARRPASDLRRASLRQVAPHLVEPADWLARQYDLKLAEEAADRFVLSLTPRATDSGVGFQPASGKEQPDANSSAGKTPAPQGPPYEIRMTVAKDGRVLEKALYQKGERQLRLAFEYRDTKVTLRWLSDEDKELASFDYQAERCDPEGAFQPDLGAYVVIDMPLRKPSYYEGHVKGIGEGEGNAVKKARLLRHLALAHMQELHWRRWGGRNQQALNALNQVKSLLQSADRKLSLGDLALLGSAGHRHQVPQWRSLTNAADTHPVVAYYQRGWQGGQKPDAAAPRTLTGHLTAYAYTVNHRKTENLRSFIHDWEDSPLLLAAAFHSGQWGRNPEACFELFENPRWRLLAIMMAAPRVKNDGHKRRIAAAFDTIHKELLEKGHHVPFSEQVGNLLRNTDNGKHWKPVIERTWEAIKASESPSSLLWFAELAMLYGESKLGEEALDQARELMGDTHPAMNALALGEAYWAGGRMKEALGHYDKVLDSMQKDQIPESPALLAAVARLAMQAGNSERAIELEERALALEHPHLPELINLQAFRRRYQWLWGQYQQSVQQAVSRKDPGAVQKWLSRAEAAWYRWYEVDTGNAGMVQQFATLQMSAGRKQEAWRALSSIIDRKPRDAQSYFNMGQWYRGRNEKEEAVTWYAESTKWDTANPRWIYEQARVLKELGRRGEANALFRKIVNGKWAPGLQGWVNRAKRELQ